METPHLIYFADPMCSWCYGFSPVIGQIRQAFGRSLPIRLVMGGLRPGTDTPTTEKAKAELVGHWGHVHEATGLPFDGAVLDRPADFRAGHPKPGARSDYGTSQRAGVTGFPTLVAGPGADGTYGVVTRGYQPAEQVLPVLHRWMGTA